MEIRCLESEGELLSIRPLVKQHHTTMKDEDFELFLQGMKDTGNRCIGMYENGNLVASVGFWIGVRFYCGKYMYANNFVVDREKRGHGMGSRLLEWLEAEARRLGCRTVVLDSYVTNSAAHRFYFGKNYSISNFHFKKDLTEAGDPARLDTHAVNPTTKQLKEIGNSDLYKL